MMGRNYMNWTGAWASCANAVPAVGKTQKTNILFVFSDDPVIRTLGADGFGLQKKV